MKIKVEVKWTESDLNQLLTKELLRHNLKPGDDEKFSWSMVDNTTTGDVEVEVQVQAEHHEQYATPFEFLPPRAAQTSAIPAPPLPTDPPVDMSTLYKYVPKEAIGPLTKAFEEAEKKAATRERLPGETPKRP